MKKGLLWILVGVLLIVPFITVKASANVQISKVELVESSDGTVINAEPTASGLNLNFNITFGSVNDYAKYSVTIKNNDGEDYKISNTEPTVSDYMKYEFVFEDDSNIIKANSEKKLNIVITYKQEVPQEELVDGKYTEINNVDVKLVNAITNEEINNPNTSDNILLYINLLLVSVILCGVAIKSKKVRKSVAVITLMLVALPLSVKALEEITIKLNTAVEISKERELCLVPSVKYFDEAEIFKFNYGSTWEEFIDLDNDNPFYIDSEFDEESVQVFFPSKAEEKLYLPRYVYFISNDLNKCIFDANKYINEYYENQSDLQLKSNSSDEEESIIEEYNNMINKCFQDYGEEEPVNSKVNDKINPSNKGCYSTSFPEVSNYLLLGK